MFSSSLIENEGERWQHHQRCQGLDIDSFHLKGILADVMEQVRCKWTHGQKRELWKITLALTNTATDADVRAHRYACTHAYT